MAGERKTRIKGADRQLEHPSADTFTNGIDPEPTSAPSDPQIRDVVNNIYIRKAEKINGQFYKRPSRQCRTP